ncbi:2-hydroxyacid dehydrogenase [Hungatella hathewayi]|uniref:2-hydroxyacid dehydrogenase n=1 Tax=Hungatella hathewayi TaxID=154046 RepID=A0AA37JKZ5_9FIRM|nr:NAD(P)-dependent oxidoreductase [Hungatella hathewayi]GKH02027.1 2-hydroxyacid dehydrogenase [Hungatella hathewayi]GKH11503.1 2-hydroxyacid dehydrogenase [Hungatella hathewayi]
MKINFLEPLGISNDRLREIVDNTIGTQHEVTYYSDRNEDPAVLVERCQGADCVVLSNMKFGRDIIEKCPELKMICVAFTGVDLVDIEYCKEKNIRVCNCAGYSTVAVADLVFGFVIDLARNVFPCNEVVRKGGTKQGLVGFELEGKKFGVIGAGAIGQRVLKIAQAFGCETYAYNRSPKEIPGVQFVTMEDLLKTCDIISIHVPQTKETIGLIGEEQFDMMKDTALFINTARGPIVDSEALAKALNEGQIAGAAVDVFEVEPPVAADHVLFGAKNLIATPHVAFASQQAFEKRAVIVAENIKSWIDGNMQNVIC